MTLDPNWGQKVTPVPSIHTPPAKVSGAQLPGQGQLEQWGLGFIDGIVEKVVLAIVGVVVPGPLVEQLQNWAQVLLPAQILQPLQDLVGLLVDLLGPIPIVGTIAHTLASYFGLLKDKTDTAQGTGEAAQTSADNANVGVAQLAAQLANQNVPGGTLYSTTFSQPAANNLGSDFTQAYGAGFGFLGTDGNNAAWFAKSSNPRSCVARLNMPMTTDYQAVAAVQDASFPVVTNPTRLRLIVRADESMTNYVEAVFSREFAEIAKIVGGVRTTLQNVFAGEAGGDRWTIKAGTDVDVRQFILFRNDDPAITVTDAAGPLSLIGPSNLFTAFAMDAGSNFIPFYYSQTAPPKVQSFTAYDRPAAA